MKKVEALKIVRDFIYDSKSSHLLFRHTDSVNKQVNYLVRYRKRVLTYGLESINCKKVTYIPFMIGGFYIDIKKEG